MRRTVSPWVVSGWHPGIMLVLAGAVLMSAACSPAGGAAQKPPTAAVQSVGKYPRTSPSPFWAPDDPVKQPDGAFGTLAPYRTVTWVLDGKPQTFTIKRFVLDSKLPAVPAKIAVYMSGVYPDSHNNPKLAGSGWYYGPEIALVSYTGTPLTPPSGDSPAAKAAALLKQYDLLQQDSERPTLLPSSDGSTAVAFFRHVAGLPVYGDKPACVGVDANGQVRSILIRRRPLLEVSLYPTMPPQEAWQRLQHNQYTKPAPLSCMDGGKELVGAIEEFRVKSVELAYWEPHVDSPRQVVMPYYVFRNEEGSSLYVPAVASNMLLDGSSTH